MTAVPMHDHDPHEHDHRSARAQQWAKVLIMLGLGVYLGYVILSGNITNYVNERFAWLSYVAAGLFLLIGVFSALHLVQDRRHSHDHHDHSHGGVSWGVLLILAVPLALGVLLPSRPLGAEAVSGDISRSSAAVVSGVQVFNVPPEQRNVLDWLRAFNSGSYEQFNGQPADLIGFVYTEPSFDERTFMVARFAISCCVADASALGVPVSWQGAAELAQGEWVRVKGSFSLASFKGDDVPVLQAASIEPVAQPEHPYLYP